MTNAERKYSDIIHLTRPEPAAVMRKHPRMDPADRAKIFCPFAALRGHAEALAAEEDAHLCALRREALVEEEAAWFGEEYV